MLETLTLKKSQINKTASFSASHIPRLALGTNGKTYTCKCIFQIEDMIIMQMQYHMPEKSDRMCNLESSINTAFQWVV